MLIIPGILSTFQSLKDRTLKLIFETNEPTPEQLMQIMQSLQKAGFMAFKIDLFSEDEKKFIEDIKVDFEDKEKSRSQRLRAVLYRNWEQTPDGYKVFVDYYNSKMETLIDHFKNKLD